MKELIESAIKKGISYTDYRAVISNLLAEGKSTGNEQSEALLHYSMLNDKRMQRLDKTITLLDETIAFIESIQTEQTWLVLSEGWCGDAAQNLPVIYKMAAKNFNIHLKIVFRDENLPLMDSFLTNGGRAIPKLIILDKANNVLATWGPRPTIAAQMVQDYKKEYGTLDADFKKDLQIWYNKDKGVNVQQDIIALLK